MEQLKIYQKIYDMIVYGNNCLLQFPRSERYALATEIKKSMYTLLRLAIAANKRYYKKTTLQEMDVELETLKTFIRVASDPKFKYLGLKQYENWSKMLSEIGRMLGGWMKATIK
ncbi:MAG: diversity-generating retroelement protein Avd [Firmicutes bacterium]|nr:diversity-generating retroelement protein Avd [Bacillota bacterium]